MNYKLVVGLGNPGDEYKETRHNIGFMVVDHLKEKLPGSFENLNKFESLYYKGRCRGRNLFLQKPMTFMNLSGKAVGKLIRSVNIAPDEVVAIYDDLDLPFGKIRLRKSGGTGGHNGVESLISELGSNNFARVRVGIGRSNSKDQSEHVLGVFSNEEQANLPDIIEKASEATKLILYRGLTEAMNRFN